MASEDKTLQILVSRSVLPQESGLQCLGGGTLCVSYPNKLVGFMYFVSDAAMEVGAGGD